MREEDIRKINSLCQVKTTILNWNVPQNNIRRSELISIAMPRQQGAGTEGVLRDTLTIRRSNEVSALELNRSQILMEEKRTVLLEGSSENELFKYTDSPLIGKHNYENAAFSMAVLKKVLGANYNSTRAVNKLSSFKGLPHRCEFIAEISGVKYINDSKGTNVAAAITALNSIDGDKIIILGGKGKGEEYNPLAQSVKKCAKYAIVIGSERERIISSLSENGMRDIFAVNTIPEAVQKASEIALRGDIVLLSPACTSWDQYENFEKRGEHFRSSVVDLIENRHDR
jgi:UDP-N-acetylmuramoylalanine--D-glutamate ligase